MKELRPHQERAISLLRESLGKGKRRPILQLPTGAGKTVIAANIIRKARERGKRVCFAVPATSLVDQTVVEFYREGLRDLGVIQGTHPMSDRSKPVQVASVQTLVSRGCPEFDLVLIDEAHRMFKVVEKWMNRDGCPFVGLSATPWSVGLGRLYDDLIIGATTRELIEAGYLSDYRVFAPAHPDLTPVSLQSGDYNARQLGEVMNQGGLVADIVQSWLLHGENRPTLCFAVNRAHAKALQQQFGSAGVEAGYIDAKTDPIERKLIEGQLRRGEIRVVCNVGCLTTGIDWDVRCIILARPTRSDMLFAQMIGRGLRTADGKADCLILDHADNHARFGFVADIHHDHLDDGHRRKVRASLVGEALPKECPKCAFLRAHDVVECPNCGFKPERQNTVEVKPGALVQIAGKNRSFDRAEKQKWYSGLLHVAQVRGRKSGWAAHAFREKFGDWPRGLVREPEAPSAEVENFVRFKDIRYAKGAAG
jgi:superfamily II DNA or RNA helicase